LNRSAIITDAQRRCRDGIRSNWLFPRLAIVDPELLCSLGPYQTACTAFDAMSHAIESYVSPRSRPATDRLALRAVQSVRQYLPLALADPQNQVARRKLALASTTMGINLSCVGTCFPHRADKALCGLHPEIAHGQSVAIFYPHWISFSYGGNVPRFALIAEFLEPDTAGESAEARASSLPRIMQSFLHRIGLNRSLADYGVTSAEIPDIVARIKGDLAANPIPVSRTQLTELVAQAFHFQEVFR
jgi:alcohol dehydrogenase class IV